MTYKELIQKIAVKEGRKSQAKVGDIREIVSIVVDMVANDEGVLPLLAKMGAARAAKNQKKVKANAKPRTAKK